MVLLKTVRYCAHTHTISGRALRPHLISRLGCPAYSIHCVVNYAIHARQWTGKTWTTWNRTPGPTPQSISPQSMNQACSGRDGGGGRDLFWVWNFPNFNPFVALTQACVPLLWRCIAITWITDCWFFHPSMTRVQTLLLFNIWLLVPDQIANKESFLLLNSRWATTH